MGISNNAPTMSYIHISGISVVWNSETYMVQDFATNKKYIYWNSDTPHQLNSSDIMPSRSTKQYLVIVNDNGMHSLVPSTSDDFSISFEGNSNQAIKDRIFGLYEKNEEFGDKFVAIEQDIDGIRSIVGETEETADGTLIDRISKVEQRADGINLSVEEISKKYNDDKEINELRENLNSAVIKLNSTLGTLKSELTDYFKNNEVSSEEQVKIKTQLEILTNKKVILEGYVNTVRLIAESNNQTQDVIALESGKKALQIAHDNLHNNVTNAVIDSIITPTENTIIIDSFAKYNLRINELKNTCDDIIILGIGGVITEELANISIKSNEIKLSVSKVEEDFKNDMSIQKIELEGQIRDVTDSVGSLEDTMNGAFKDGILSESEKQSINQHLLTVSSEKVDIDKRYATLYSNEHLEGTAKTNLTTAYNNYIRAYNSLVTVINNILEKVGLVDSTDKNNLNNAFQEHNSKLGLYSTADLNALDYIAKKKAEVESSKIDKKYADIILDPETGIVSKVEHINQELNGTGGLVDRISTAESKITDESITNTVSKSFYTKGDIDNKGYQTSSQVQQTVDDFKFKFEESGGYNRLYNSSFKNGFDQWSLLSWNNNGGSGGSSFLEIRQIGDEWTLTNRNCIGAVASNLTTLTGQQLGVGFDSHRIWGGRDWTFSCLLSCHRANNVTIEIVEHDNDGNRIHAQGWTFTGVKTGGQNRNNWTKVHKQFSLQGNGTAWFIVRVFMGDWNGAMNTAYLWMAEPLLVLGHKDDLPYTPNSDELYSGITTIDKDGVKVSHSNINGYSEMSADAFKIHKDNKDIFKVDSNGLRILDGDIQVSHNDGSYTKMSYDGFKRYESGVGRTYHYYMQEGTALLSHNESVYVDVPDHILQKKGFTVTVAQVVSPASASNNYKYSLNNFIVSTFTYTGKLQIQAFLNWAMREGIYIESGGLIFVHYLITG